MSEQVEFILDGDQSNKSKSDYSVSSIAVSEQMTKFHCMDHIGVVFEAHRSVNDLSICGRGIQSCAESLPLCWCFCF